MQTPAASGVDKKIKEENHHNKDVTPAASKIEKGIKEEVNKSGAADDDNVYEEEDWNNLDSKRALVTPKN